jgi:hypothetical protein
VSVRDDLDRSRLDTRSEAPPPAVDRLFSDGNSYAPVEVAATFRAEEKSPPKWISDTLKRGEKGKSDCESFEAAASQHRHTSGTR